MALQDLTPQLRTRLSRMERAVGWFVILAMVLLTFGFGYYVYTTAERKGWFKTKAMYFTFTTSAGGLKAGDPVNLMGLAVGQITKMEPMDPSSEYNMYVEFELTAPYYGYMWTEGSHAAVVPASLLGNRSLEVTKGTNGYPIYVFNPLRTVTLPEFQSLPDPTNWVLAQEILQPNGSNLLAKPMYPLNSINPISAAAYSNLVIMATNVTQKLMSGIWDGKGHRYRTYKKGDTYWLPADETPPVTEQLQAVIAEVQAALPNILSLTNQLITVLTNSADLTSNLNYLVISARPAVSNLVAATAHLDHPGALGEWLLPTNLNRQLDDTLGTARSTLASADTNLTVVVLGLSRSLDNLAAITGNLNKQVAANPEMLTAISRTIVHADDFVQGLKRFWLFRRLFPAQPAKGAANSRTNSPGQPSKVIPSPKAKAEGR